MMVISDEMEAEVATEVYIPVMNFGEEYAHEIFPDSCKEILWREWITEIV